MKYFRAFLLISLISLKRTIITGMKSKSFIRNVILNFISTGIFIGLFYLSFKCVSQELKLVLPSLIIANLFYFFYIAFGLGILLGLIYFKYMDREEISYWLSLPIPPNIIAKWRISLFILEIFAFIVVIFIYLFPWTVSNVRLGVLFSQWLFVSTFLLLAFTIGVCLFTLIVKVFSNPLVQKSIIYFVAYGFLIFSLFNINKLSFNFNYFKSQVCNVAFLLKSVGVFFIVILILILTITKCFYDVLEKFDVPIISKAHRRVKSQSYGSFVLAVVKKDLLTYFREKDEILQLVAILGLIIFIIPKIIKSNIEWNSSLLISSILLSIPYSFVGTLTLHMIGRDGAVLTTIKMIRGTLKGYYLIRTLLSYILTAIPSFIFYMLLSVVFYKDGLYIENIILLLFLNFGFVLLSLGLSVAFFKVDPSVVYFRKRGVSLYGEVIYWIAGIIFLSTTVLIFIGHVQSTLIKTIFFMVLLIICLLYLMGFFYIDKINENRNLN